MKRLQAKQPVFVSLLSVYTVYVVASLQHEGAELYFDVPCDELDGSVKRTTSV
jgi:hypothetical protein